MEGVCESFKLEIKWIDLYQRFSVWYGVRSCQLCSPSSLSKTQPKPRSELLPPDQREPTLRYCKLANELRARAPGPWCVIRNSSLERFVRFRTGWPRMCALSRKPMNWRFPTSATILKAIAVNFLFRLMARR